MGGTPKGTKASTRDAERSPPVPEHRCGCPPPFLGGQAPPATPVASTLWNLGGLEGREARVLELECGREPSAGAAPAGLSSNQILGPLFQPADPRAASWTCAPFFSFFHNLLA